MADKVSYTLAEVGGMITDALENARVDIGDHIGAMDGITSTPFSKGYDGGLRAAMATLSDIIEH